MLTVEKRGDVLTFKNHGVDISERVEELSKTKTFNSWPWGKTLAIRGHKEVMIRVSLKIHRYGFSLSSILRCQFRILTRVPSCVC